MLIPCYIAGSCRILPMNNKFPYSTIMHTDTGIAIIGMGCRLPGDVNSPESFWELLIRGRSSWSEVPPERWNAKAYYHPSSERKGTVSWDARQILLQRLIKSRLASKVAIFSMAALQILMHRFSP